MQRLAFDVLGKAVGFDEAAGPDDAGDGRVFCKLLLLDEELQGAQAAAAGLNAIFAGLFASLIVEGAHAQALQKAASLDVCGEAGNGSVRLHMAGVAVVQDELIERDACGLSQPDFLFGLGHDCAPLIEGSGLGRALSLSDLALRPSLSTLFLCVPPSPSGPRQGANCVCLRSSKLKGEVFHFSPLQPLQPLQG